MAISTAQFSRFLASRSLRWGTAVLALVLALIAISFASSTAGRLTESAQRAAMRETLNVQTEVLNGLLDLHRLHAVTLAHSEEIERVFDQSLPAPQRHEEAVRQLREAATYSGALDVALYDRNGNSLASAFSRFDLTLDVAAPPIEAALHGLLGRQARVLNAGARTYLIASGVRDKGGTIVGVVVVFVNLARVETPWALSRNPIFAVAETRNVFISNRLNWRLRPERAVAEISSDGTQAVADGLTYLMESRHLPLLNWDLRVLSPVQPVTTARLLWGALAGLSVFVVWGVALALLMRAQRQWLRQRQERANAERLERLVRERTTDLRDTNRQLSIEVEERRQAVEQLKKTQAELVQAGKLAALGQMSAAISHELNQPLAAARTYAENALKLIERGREEEAVANISRISQLAERASLIAKHLRNFARKPNPSFEGADLASAVRDALSVLEPRVAETGASITVGLPNEAVMVRGGAGRLQQVVVNLVSNALDATASVPNAHIEINLSQSENAAEVTVADNGPGISPEVMETLFDPFVTTKGVGQGLGLGLSISYNIVRDFGGQLAAENAEEGGAMFHLRLQKLAQTKPGEEA